MLERIPIERKKCRLTTVNLKHQGVIDTIKWKDITLVSYGSTLRLVEQAAKGLLEIGLIVK
jgi:hypothetical protein